VLVPPFRHGEHRPLRRAQTKALTPAFDYTSALDQKRRLGNTCVRPRQAASRGQTVAPISGWYRRMSELCCKRLGSTPSAFCPLGT